MRQQNEEIDVTFTIYIGLLPGTALVLLGETKPHFLRIDFSLLWLAWLRDMTGLPFRMTMFSLQLCNPNRLCEMDTICVEKGGGERSMNEASPLQCRISETQHTVKCTAYMVL